MSDTELSQELTQDNPYVALPPPVSKSPTFASLVVREVERMWEETKYLSADVDRLAWKLEEAQGKAKVRDTLLFVGIGLSLLLSAGCLLLLVYQLGR